MLPLYIMRQRVATTTIRPRYDHSTTYVTTAGLPVFWAAALKCAKLGCAENAGPENAGPENAGPNRRA